MSDQATVITFVTHTNKPGGGELALRRYLETTSLPVRLITIEPNGIWSNLPVEVIHAPNLRALRSSIGNKGLVVANTMRAAFMTALVAHRKVQLVYWVRDSLQHSAMSPHALALTRHITARRAYHYVANSNWTASTIHEALGVDPGRIHVAYSMCGVSVESIRSLTRTDLHEPLRLLYLGRLSEWKAPHVAVHAVTELRNRGINATLTIAGEAHFGEERYSSRLARLVATEPAATMIGHQDAITGLLDSHDMLIHCSTSPEPFGQVLVQGLASGMPVIATDHGGPVEILKHAPVNLLYRPGDPSSLAGAIIRAMPSIAKVSKWATQRAFNFTDEQALESADISLTSLRDHPDLGTTRSES